MLLGGVDRPSLKRSKLLEVVRVVSGELAGVVMQSSSQPEEEAQKRRQDGTLEKLEIAFQAKTKWWLR